jgi:hypothetical protein
MGLPTNGQLKNWRGGKPADGCVLDPECTFDTWIQSLASVNNRCTPRVAEARNWDVAPIIRSLIVLAAG